MNKIKYVSILILIVFYSCSQKKDGKTTNNEFIDSACFSSRDSLVQSNQLSGGCYRNTLYFFIESETCLVLKFPILSLGINECRKIGLDETYIKLSVYDYSDFQEGEILSVPLCSDIKIIKDREPRISIVMKGEIFLYRNSDCELSIKIPKGILKRYLKESNDLLDPIVGWRIDLCDVPG